jgi:hypothetical protein
MSNRWIAALAAVALVLGTTACGSSGAKRAGKSKPKKAKAKAAAVDRDYTPRGGFR